MTSSKHITLDVLQHFEGELSAPPLAEFLQFARRKYCLETISYVWPARSLWLIQDPWLALAYSDASIESAATARRGENGQDDALNWPFLARLEAKLEQLRSEAAAAPPRRSFTVPLHGPEQSLAGFMQATMAADELSSERLADLNVELVKIANYIHRSAQQLFAGEAVMEPLTPREAAALRLYSEGSEIGGVAAAMRVAPAIARAHLDSARAKLGALTLTRAAAKALRAQLI